MEFILRILFTGLIAFVPSEDGTEVTVLLLNAGHAYHTSDGSAMAPHKAMLIAAAGNCTGTCPKRDSEIAQAIFADQTPATALDSIEEAVGGGGAWVLNGSDLSLRKGSSGDPDLPALEIVDDARGTSNGQPLLIPTTSAEVKDFSWVANLKELCSNCTLDQSVLGDNPPEGLVAARFKLRSGKLFTWSVARIGSNVTPAHFQRRDGTGSVSPYTQAIASWVGAEIEISGDSIEIVEDKFDNGTGRSMLLEPDENGKVEIAVLNLPPFVPPASQANDAPEVGKHFEMFYELVENPPAKQNRLVPRPGAAPGAASYPSVSWSLVHPSTVVQSELLNQLRMEAGRTLYDRSLCPPTQNPLP